MDFDISLLSDLGGAEREIAKRSMLGYVRYMMPEYEVNWHHELVCHYVDKFVSGEVKKLIVTLPPQHGKLLAHDTPVLTQNRGWVTHGDIVVGDTVFGRNGEPVKVLALSDEDMTEYDVTFADGTVINCHGNHEWVVNICYGDECVKETKELYLLQNSGELITIDYDDDLVCISSIEKTNTPKVGRCIQVEGGIYLVGETLIPTHNSEITSRMLPSYLFGKNPDSKVLLCSYNAEKAEEFNREIQRYLDKPEYHVLFPHVQLQKAGTNGAYVRNTKRFDITGHRGFLKSVGVGGGITGTPVDIAIIDDPVKGREEANSLTTLESIWGWYNSDLLSRLHNNSKQLIIMTRWDSEDLVGRILDKMTDGDNDWTIVNLPAIKENDDNPEDPRKIGEALWENRHGLKKLLEAKKLDPRTFQSLYQQNPMPVQVGGECYKEFDAERIVLKELKYNPDLPLHCTFDFNVNPYNSCSVWQVEGYSKVLGDGDIKKYYNVNKIKEYALRSPKNTTQSVCSAIRQDFAEHVNGMFVYGDPHGMDEDTRSEKGHNDYRIIMRELSKFSPTLRINKKADHVKTRIGFMNAIFGGRIDNMIIRIDSKCVRSIEDYQYIKEDSDGTKFKQMWTDPSTGVRCQRYGHMSDNDEYFIPVCFQKEYIKYQQGGGSTMPMMMGQRKNSWRGSKNMY